MGPHASALMFAALSLALPARAQDTRNVTEPLIPRNCKVLTAALSAIDGNKTIAASDESKLDTRIQQALDACPKVMP